MAEKKIEKRRGAAALLNIKKEINLEMKNKLLAFMREDAYKPLSHDELVQAFQDDLFQVSELDEVLNSLLEEGSIILTRKNKYGLTEKMNMVAGRIQGNRKGYGFLIPDNKEIRDLFIPAENLNGAMNDDRVIVRLTAGELGAKRSEGEVIRILKRANSRIVGTFENDRGFGFVVPDDPDIPGYFRIQPTSTVRRKDIRCCRDNQMAGSQKKSGGSCCRGTGA